MSDVDVPRLTLIEEREKSILVEQDGKRYWLPRSQISYLRKDPSSSAGQTISIKLSEWCAEQKETLDYY